LTGIEQNDINVMMMSNANDLCCSYVSSVKRQTSGNGCVIFIERMGGRDILDMAI